MGGAVRLRAKRISLATDPAGDTGSPEGLFGGGGRVGLLDGATSIDSRLRGLRG